MRRVPARLRDPVAENPVAETRWYGACRRAPPEMAVPCGVGGAEGRHRVPGSGAAGDDGRSVGTRRQGRRYPCRDRRTVIRP
jgi:hypothetical protein